MVDRACRDCFSSREENIGRKVGHKEAASDVKGAKEVESCEGTIRRSIAAIFEAERISNSYDSFRFGNRLIYSVLDDLNNRKTGF